MRHLLALALVAMTTLVAVPSTAAESGDDEPVGRLMLVLDSSGSMSELTGDGRTRIDAAKDALRAVVNQLPDEQPVGMRVFGATQPTRAGAELYCSDSQNVAPVATDNRDDLNAAIDAYEPYGETPIAYALQEAGTDLGAEGQRSIVLVSDGLATCEPDPCLVAEQLRAGGVDVRIDVVGLNVDAAARASLECVASAGGGTYYDATDTASLVDGLTTAQTRSARPFDLTGEPIEGTPDVSDAPRMTAPGQYVDTLPVDGALFYRIPRTQIGSTIHVGVSYIGESGSAGESVRMSLYPGSAPEGLSCASGSAFGNGIGSANPYHFDGVASWKATPDDPCNLDEDLVLALENSNPANAGKPVEIAVYEEPPLADDADRDVEPAPEAPAWQTLEPSGSPETDVVPGSSLASAPVLTDGSYELDINQGETQVFAVPLDWGQNLQAQIDMTLTQQTIDAAHVGYGFSIDVVGPLRTDDGDNLYGKGRPADWNEPLILASTAGTPLRTGTQTPTVAYLQRAGALPVRGAAIPGYRYVQVAFEANVGSNTQPYTLTLKTSGEAGDGAPEYDTSQLSAPEADSSLVSSPVRNVDTEATSADGDAGDDGGFPVLPVGLGAAGVLALLAAGALLIRSRVSAGR